MCPTCTCWAHWDHLLSVITMDSTLPSCPQWFQHAVNVYWDGLNSPESSHIGFQAACHIVEKAMKAESGIDLKISHNTV